MGLERKVSRQRKKLAEKEMAKKMGLFSQLSEECLSCLTPFDKTNREMVQSWTVVVREKEKEVRLYCPDCWSTATKIVGEE